MISVEENVQKDSDLRKQIKRVNIILVAVLAVLIIGPAAVTWAISRQYPSISTITIENMQIVGESALCPGDTLTVTYDFRAAGSGVLVRDATTWQLEPPRTIIFSISRRFILGGPVEQHLTEAWHVPRTFLNPATDNEETLLPGAYRRYLAISSPSRSSVIAIASVEFIVREDC